MDKKRFILLLLGPVLFGLCIALLPADIFTSFAARAAIGTVAWMALWWIAAPVDYAVTALLPIVLNAIFSITDMSSVIAQYASETILLLLGASIISVSWEETGLDRRIATACLTLIGSSLAGQIAFWFLFSALLSAFLPNAVVAATLTPIAVSMLRFAGEGDVAESPSASIILMTIVWGAGIGGLATPLGGAMNLTVIRYIEQVTGEEFLYSAWVVRFAPVMLVLVLTNLGYLLLIRPRGARLPGTRAYFQAERRKLGRMTGAETVSLVLFLAATGASFLRGLYAELLPGLKPAYVFLLCGILTFLPKKTGGGRMMSWASTQKKIVWGLMYVFAGGLALGCLITGSGADAMIGEAVGRSALSGGFGLCLLLITVTLVLSDVTSNTATAAVSMPIVISVTNGLGLDPIPYICAATIGVNLSYCLPTSIRAVPVGYGLPPRYMLRRGLPLSLAMILIMSALSWALLRWWSSIPPFAA